MQRNAPQPTAMVVVATVWCWWRLADLLRGWAEYGCQYARNCEQVSTDFACRQCVIVVLYSRPGFTGMVWPQPVVVPSRRCQPLLLRPPLIRHRFLSHHACTQLQAVLSHGQLDGMKCANSFMRMIIQVVMLEQPAAAAQRAAAVHACCWLAYSCNKLFMMCLCKAACSDASSQPSISTCASTWSQPGVKSLSIPN